MKVKKFEIENHDVLGNIGIDLMSDSKFFHLLVGNNGSGKTMFMEAMHESIDNGFSTFQDSVKRKMSVILSDAEKDEIGKGTKDFEFVYDGSRPNNTSGVKVYFDRGGNGKGPLGYSSPDFHHLIFQPVFQKSCRYSPTEISFADQLIKSITTSELDENIMTKSDSNLPQTITQLLVDLKSQDAMEALRREEDLAGTGNAYRKHRGKFERFKDAFDKMFETKSLQDTMLEGGEHKILFYDREANETFNINGLSTGEKQIVYRAGYLLSNLGNRKSGIVFIDEPEISLHPKWQKKYLNFLENMFKDEHGNCGIQFIIATHSPYIIQGADFAKTKVWEFKRNGASIEISNIEDSWSHFSHGPTMGEINYKVFGITNIEFHCDLYNKLISLHAQSGKIAEIENFLHTSKCEPKSISWTDSNGNAKTETLMTAIRNKIHHADNTNRPDFSDSQLKESIDKMISWMP